MSRIVEAAVFQKFVEQGYVRCSGCEEDVDLSDADDINDAVAIWNTHVQDVHGGNKPDWAEDSPARFPTDDDS